MLAHAAWHLTVMYMQVVPEDGEGPEGTIKQRQGLPEGLEYSMPVRMICQSVVNPASLCILGIMFAC